MTEIKIVGRYDSSKVILQGKYESVKDCLEKNKDKDLSRANLYGANLYGANLYGANLTGAYLSEANLYGANLTGANLYEANLYGAYLTGAYLSEANLYGANLTGAYLSRANLHGAYLYEANLTGAYLYEANLYGAYLTGAYLYEANLYGANLAGIKSYYNIHEIALEIIRQQEEEYFTDAEWIFIGKLSTHRPCWGKIRTYEKAEAVCEKLAKLGFDEYLKKYKEEI